MCSRRLASITRSSRASSSASQSRQTLREGEPGRRAPAGRRSGAARRRAARSRSGTRYGTWPITGSPRACAASRIAASVGSSSSLYAFTQSKPRAATVATALPALLGRCAPRSEFFQSGGSPSTKEPQATMRGPAKRPSAMPRARRLGGGAVDVAGVAHRGHAVRQQQEREQLASGRAATPAGSARAGRRARHHVQARVGIARRRAQRPRSSRSRRRARPGAGARRGPRPADQR